jgi:hypothetical protein
MVARNASRLPPPARILALLGLLALVIVHGLDRNATCGLMCAAVNGRGDCCGGPAPHDPRSPCCESMSHAPAEGLLAASHAPPVPAACVALLAPPAAATAAVAHPAPHPARAAWPPGSPPGSPFPLLI